jgi:hypothetical protein
LSLLSLLGEKLGAILPLDVLLGLHLGLLLMMRKLISMLMYQITEIAAFHHLYLLEACLTFLLKVSHMVMPCLNLDGWSH